MELRGFLHRPLHNIHLRNIRLHSIHLHNILRSQISLIGDESV
jgi:hypothetical protein